MHDLVLLFDGVCNLCDNSVQFLIKRDPNQKFKFASLQSDTGQEMLGKHGLPTEQLFSLVLVDHGKAYTRSSAALRSLYRLGGAYSLLYGLIVIPKVIRDWIYDWVARNRYKWFGKKDNCMIPEPGVANRFIDV